MLANTRVWCRFILPLIIVASVWQDVEGSGRVQIHLVSYEDMTGRMMGETCCDEEDTTVSCRPCDHYIAICLMDVREHFKGPCISNNVTTETLPRSSTIIFGSDIGNVTNPFSLYFTLPSRYIQLQFIIYGKSNMSILAELLENIEFELYRCQPVLFGVDSPMLPAKSSTPQHRLVFQYRLQCDEDFYSMCDQFCHSNASEYRCNQKGQRICTPGKHCETSRKSEITTIYPGSRGNATSYTKVTKMDVGHISKHQQRSISAVFLNASETTLYTTLSPNMETLSEVDDSLLRLTSLAHSTGTSLPTRDLHSTTPESSAIPSIPSIDKVPAQRDKVPLFIGIILGAVLCIIVFISSIIYFILHRRNKNKVKNDGITDDDDDMVHDENIVIGDKIPLKVQNALNV